MLSELIRNERKSWRRAGTGIETGTGALSGREGAKALFRSGAAFLPNAARASFEDRIMLSKTSMLLAATAVMAGAAAGYADPFDRDQQAGDPHGSVLYSHAHADRDQASSGRTANRARSAPGHATQPPIPRMP